MTKIVRIDGAHGFVDNIRKLWCLDKYAVPFLTNDEWIKFRDDPPGFLIRCNDKHLEGIWDAIQAKEQEVLA